MRNARHKSAPLSLALAAFAAAGLAACADRRSEPPNEPWHGPTDVSSPFIEHIADLAQASCPAGTTLVQPQSMTIEIEPVPLGNAKDMAAALNGLRYVGGWQLTSEEPNFGGLSGLDILPSGDLLTVSDTGAFVWIGMDASAPDGSGSVAYMRNSDGRLLSGKAEADSEGLAVHNGLALVSFEREHRILAFDIENCGAVAKGAHVAAFSNRPDNVSTKIPDNRGAEALMLSPAGALVTGLEQSDGRLAILGKVTPGRVDFSARIQKPRGAGALTGLDTLDDTIFTLFRSYSPISGNRIDIQSLDGLDDAMPVRLATLRRPLTVDNFEGIAATRLPDGTVRLYIISDDNFSNSQRTLLMAFDVTSDNAP